MLPRKVCPEARAAVNRNTTTESPNLVLFIRPPESYWITWCLIINCRSASRDDSQHVVLGLNNRMNWHTFVCIRMSWRSHTQVREKHEDARALQLERFCLCNDGALLPRWIFGAWSRRA